MIAGANQNPNINFETFVNLVANNKDNVSENALFKLDGHNIKMKEAGEDKIGAWSRKNEQQTVNNAIREAFLSSVLTRLNKSNASQLPYEIKKQMALNDFNGPFRWASSLTGKEGCVTTGKPLSLRRIRAVVQAVQNYEASRVEHLGSYLKSVEFKGRSSDVMGNLFTKLASYSDGATIKNLAGNRNVKPDQQVTALCTRLKEVPQFKDYINNDPNGLKRLALEQYANSGTDVSHQIAKGLLEMLRIDECVNLAHELRNLESDDKRLERMDKMTAKELVSFFKTAFAKNAFTKTLQLELAKAQHLANSYFMYKIGPMLINKNGVEQDGRALMWKYPGNYSTSFDGKSFHNTSCAKVVLQTIQETVLAKVGKDSEYSGVIERMLEWI